MAGKIKVGVFGGARGHAMMDVLFDHPHAELTAVCDKYQPLLDKVAKEAEEKGLLVGLFTNFDDFLSSDLDAVVLANYANEHAPYAIRLPAGGQACPVARCCPAKPWRRRSSSSRRWRKAARFTPMPRTTAICRAPLRCGGDMRKGSSARSNTAEGEYIHDCSRRLAGDHLRRAPALAQPPARQFLLHPQHRPDADGHRAAAGSGGRV